MLVMVLASVLALQDRSPIPDPAAQKESERLIKDVFKDDYAKKTPADRAALAEKLMIQSRETKDDPTARYVLLREAQDLYANVGDLENSLGTIEELGRHYVVDAIALKIAAITSATKLAKTADDHGRLAAANLRLAGEAIQLDQYEMADKTVQAASAAAKKAGALAIVIRANAKSKEIADLKSRYDKLKKARETLTTTPDDASANLAVGQFEATIKGNWESALPFLAKGSDAALKAAAEKDLAGPKEAVEQAGAGDAWWDLAEKETAAAKDNLRSRALFWYSKAEEKLTGLVRAKIAKRLLDTRLERISRGTWVDVSDPKLYGVSQTPLEVGQRKTPLTKLPSGTFDGLTLRAKSKGGDVHFGVQYEPEVRDMEMNSLTGRFAMCHLEGTTWKSDIAAMCPKKDEYIITLLITDGEHVFYVDGKEVGRLKLINDKIIGLQFYGWVGNTQFDQIKLRKKE